MTKGGSKILRGAREALAWVEGELTEGVVVHTPEVVDAKRIRTALGLTQADFAAQFGFDVASVRNWEQGRRQPEGPARVLLTVIDHEPDAVRRALAAVLKPTRRTPKRRKRPAPRKRASASG